MEKILKNPANAERLLALISDTMLILDKDGVCIDIAIQDNSGLWFLNEDLLGKNVFRLLPRETCRQVYPAFIDALKKGKRSARNYEMTLRGTAYYFKCIMYPFDGHVLCQYRDITERSLRKLELEKTNRELNEIQKAAAIGIWRYYPEEETFVYSGYTGVMCEAEEQRIGKEEYLKLVVPEDRDKFCKWLQENVGQKSTDGIDYRLCLHDCIHYIRLKAYSYDKQADGRIVLEGYIQNITDIQRSRNDINLLTHAVNNSSEDIYAAREDGTLLFANCRFRERHGIPGSADVSAIRIYELPTYGRDRNGWKEFVRSVKEGIIGTSYLVENPIPSHPEVLAIEANSYWITGDDGMGSIWTTGRDVSMRIRNEQEIQRLNLVLNKTIENLPAGIVVKDIRHDFAYLYRNRESYNRSENIQEAIGKTDYDFYPKEIADQKRAIDTEVARSGKEQHWVEEEKDMNGKTIYLDKRKMRIGGKGFSPILLSIEWDITDMEKMKRELLIAKEKAETSDQLKSAFLANMSHEIRTPLNAIVGFSRIIAESADADERRNYYNIVESNNERLLELINEILDLSKIEAGMAEFTISPVRLNGLCKDIYEACRFCCPSGVELIFEPSDHSIVIDTDKNRVFQVISNLINNAYKFTTQGSIRYGYVRQGHDILFHVRDTGLGIEPEKLSKVFDRFVKMNDFAQGTGLGLSICKTIVEKLGGHIEVRSQIGHGTEFLFTLPAETQDGTALPAEEEIPGILPGQEGTTTAQPEERPATTGTAPTGGTILIAEDIDSNYILAKAILGRHYHLQRAKDGMEAVTMFEEVHPDLILMDMKMPNLDGLDATRIIRQLSPDIPIIALTAYAYDHDRQAAMEAGCTDFLTKPYTQEALNEMIGKYLRK